MALIKACLAIIPVVMHEGHVLIQLLLRLGGHTSSGQSALVVILRYVHERRTRTVLRKALFESGNDLLGRLVVRRSEHTLAEQLLAMRENAFDELAGIIPCVEHGNGRIVGHGQGKSISVVGWGLADETFKVGHEEPGHEESCRDSDIADVLLNGGFGVEVLYVWEFTVGEVVDVEEGRPDEVLDTGFLQEEVRSVVGLLKEMTNLGEVGDIPALLLLELSIHLLPIVGDSEDGISSLECGLDLFLVVDIGGDSLDTFFLQSFGIGFGRVSGDAADLEFVCSLGITLNGLDDRTSLVTRGTKHDDDFLLCHCLCLD